MDVDAFVLANRPTWDRLERLVRKRRKLTGAEVDELVDLYQRVSTHLSMVRSESSDAVLIGKLSGLVAHARSVVTGAHAPLWHEFVRFWTVSFPVVAYRSWRWWLGSAIGFVFVTVLIAWWIAGNPEVQAAIGTPAEIEELVDHDFAAYYSENPAGSFALGVWVNNAWIAALCIGSSVLLGIPIPYVLLLNAENVGQAAGLMFDAGKGDIFLGLITPHGLIELTAVLLAAGVGMRLGWSVVSPGDRPRGQVLAEQGRAVIAVAIGLVAVLLVAGIIERSSRPRRFRRSRVSRSVWQPSSLSSVTWSTSAVRHPGSGRPVTSTTRPTSCQRADARPHTPCFETELFCEKKAEISPTSSVSTRLDVARLL